MTQKEQLLLMPHRLCETRGGNLAHTIGRIVFRPGRPMLVEHLGGLYLEHDLLTGGVMTPGFGEEYSIIHMYEADRACCTRAVCRGRRPARWRHRAT